jgi:GTP pyrophosphokinase
MKLDALIEIVTCYADSEAGQILRRAYQIAEEAHQGFERRNKDLFMHHPLAVGHMLADWYAPATVVAAGLLHDIVNPEYSNYSHDRALDRVQRALGQEVTRLVQEVWQLNRFTARFWTSPQASLQSAEPQSLPSFSDALLALQSDPATLVVKLADRLHNLQTLKALSALRQERTAATILNVYSPLADRLGMRCIKRQLDDLSFSVLHPHVWSPLQQQYRSVGDAAEISDVRDALQQVVMPVHRKSEIRWQPFHVYGLYRRYWKGENLRFKPLETGCLVITVQSVGDCYHVLGAIHECYRPMVGTFRDFIAEGEENGYRALHTQVMYRPGLIIGVVIRTVEMDLVAEWGITAQWRSVTEGLPHLPQRPILKPGQIMVFTPQGEAKYLPEGATPVDFAYDVHSEVGRRCIRAVVNGESVHLHQPLQTGDRVEIILGGPGREPSRYWLKFVRTSKARRLIQKYVDQRDRDSMLGRGRDLLNKHLQPHGLSVADTAVGQWLERLASQKGFRGQDELLASVGAGWLRASPMVRQFVSGRTSVSVQPAFNVVVLSIPEANLPRQLARCCNPDPSDDIVGYRKNDNTISIHKSTCTRFTPRGRLISVAWDDLPIKPTLEVNVEAWNRPALVRDLSEVISRQQWDMGYFTASKRPDGTAIVHFSLENVPLTLLHSTLAELRTLPGVRKVLSTDISVAEEVPRAHQRQYVSNPYGLRPAVGKQFYGREHEQRVIINHLSNPHQNTAILLWGQRRIGKTSLLYHLSDALRDAFILVLVDMEGLQEASTTEFLYALMLAIEKHLKSPGISRGERINVPNRQQVKKDPLGRFRAFMETVQQEMGSQVSLLIILDEFQHLVSLREEGISRNAIFGYLRSLVQHGVGVSFILSGGGLETRLTEQASAAAFLNVIPAEPLRCLEPDAARALVSNGLHKVVNCDKAAIDALLDATACHPYYLQLLCAYLFDHTQRDEWTHRRITLQLVLSTIHDWIRDSSYMQYFQHLWEERKTKDSKRNKLILSAIADPRGTPLDVSDGYLAATLAGVIPKAELEQALQNLRTLDILERHDSHYTIRVPLFARWLRWEYPFTLALKEYQTP